MDHSPHYQLIVFCIAVLSLRFVPVCSSASTAPLVRPTSGTRALRVLSVVFACSLVWLSIVRGWVDASPLLSTAGMQVVATLPLWCIVAFGAYSLSSIGWNLITFRDCPEAFIALEKDIQESRQRLTKKGFKFDE